MRAMILKEFRELHRDRRTMAMLVVLPMLLLTIFGFAANFTVDTLTAVVVGPQAEQVVATIDAGPAGDRLDCGTCGPRTTGPTRRPPWSPGATTWRS